MAALLGEKKRQDNGSLAETEGMPPALRSRREELSDALVRWLTYLSGIAVLFIAAAHVFQPRPTVMASAPIERVQWAEIEKPIPAFALAIPEAENAPAGYAIRRARIGGGRKDILTLGDADSVEPYLHVEIYRPGSEIGRFATPAVTIAGDAEAEAMGPVNIRQETEPLASKFGPLTIVTFDTSNGASRGCLAFVRAYDDPRLQLSVWFCRGGELVKRSTLACALDRLTLLSAGSEPKVQALFAQAELHRAFCGQHDPILASTPKYRQLWKALPTRPMPRRVGR
jgi:hypothetical protein